MISPTQIKAENISRLQQLGIPTLEHLPELEAPADLSPRSAAEVARRVMILSHVAGLGFGAPTDVLAGALEDFDLWDHLSESELDLFESEQLTEEEKAAALWQPECIQSFAWCLGVAGLDSLRECDDDLVSHFPAPFQDPSDFIATAKLRPFEEIYREADFHYRLHWAARNAALKGEAFPGSEAVIEHRRRALDWVIGTEEDWDDIDSST